jgi:hypothetical protein
MNGIRESPESPTQSESVEVSMSEVSLETNGHTVVDQSTDDAQLWGV